MVIFFIANYIRKFFIKFIDQGQIFIEILNIEIDKEITEIFKVKGKAQFEKTMKT